MTLHLGLIGDNIARSRSPLLHELAGEQAGVCVRYDRLIPADLGQSFETVFDTCRAGDFRGINITYPYKERVATMVVVDEPLERAIGAVNTVIFDREGPRGHNTDYSGFISAYRRVRAGRAPGSTLMVGTGGVGRAVAYALVTLGVTELRLVDREREKAARLAEELRLAAPGVQIETRQDNVAAAAGAEGVVNCTPVGMYGHEGTPLPTTAMTGGGWAFDAVYTPKDTQFLADAEAAGRTPISGWELFFYQGVHAWHHFAGVPLDEDRLRADLDD